MTFDKSSGRYNEEEIFNYLEQRKNILDGICITGGEPLLQLDIKDFIKKVKNLNLKVKLDTNGTNYLKLKELIDEDLVDYVAMDVKNTFEKYPLTTGVKELDLDNIKKSMALLKKGKIEYEFRTTIVKDFHKYEDIENICKIIGKNSKYYLQNFIDSDNVLKKGLHGFSDEELINMKEDLETNYNNVKIRGL